MTRIAHGKLELALHRLRAGRGRALLLLHGLGERSPAAVPDDADGWPGPVAALDFTGHGASQLPRGGGYTPEILVADADAGVPVRPQASQVAPDPFALAELARDVRPPDYAASFAGLALGSGLEHPIAVCAAERPPWLAAVAAAPGAWTAHPLIAVAAYAAVRP